MNFYNEQGEIVYKFQPSKELEDIDCNCNNCIHMVRDLEKFRFWEEKRRASDLEDFEKKKAKAIEDAKKVSDPKGRESMLNIAHKMKFQFDRSGLLSYGDCDKFNKPVSFIHNTCQIETQHCFVHRKG